jgi:hypothetical protein
MPYSSKAFSGIMKKYFVTDTNLFENQQHHCEINIIIIIIIIIIRRREEEGREEGKKTKRRRRKIKKKNK